MNYKIHILLLVALSTIVNACNTEEDLSMTEILYTFPEESEPHEGTWLQWPHQYQYGATYRNRIESTWVEMTRQLVQSENVHIISYNHKKKEKYT